VVEKRMSRKKLYVNRNAINLVRRKKDIVSNHRYERVPLSYLWLLTILALRYMSEGCEFDYEWGYWNSSLT